jgi:hypothetical protein
MWDWFNITMLVLRGVRMLVIFIFFWDYQFILMTKRFFGGRLLRIIRLLFGDWWKQNSCLLKLFELGLYKFEEFPLFLNKLSEFLIYLLR